MWEKSRIDLDRLKYELQHLKPTQQLYKLLRDELTRQGHWKYKKRGKPNPSFCKKQF